MNVVKDHWPIILFFIGAVTAFAQIQSAVGELEKDVESTKSMQERFYKLEEKVESIRNELADVRLESREYNGDIMEGILEVKKILIEKKIR